MKMRLAEWLAAIAWLYQAQTENAYGTPLPEAMAALNIESRATFYRRLRELNQAGLRLTVEGDNLKIWHIPPGACQWANHQAWTKNRD